MQITFNDDGGDLIRNLWYNYFNYYYKDPVNQYEGVPNTNGTSGNLQTTQTGFSYNTSDTYSTTRVVNDWGFAGESYSDGNARADARADGKPAFFNDIKIYGLNQHKFAAYVLINPMITDWRHDTYDYAQGTGTMTHTVTIRYETVKYYSGAIGASRPDTNVDGFGDPNYYDQIRSSLAREGSQALFSFSDSAPGVPGEELPHLFERFHRVERSRSRDTGGAGLGLAICQNIALAHGGRISVGHSALGGLCVQLRLPLDVSGEAL